MINKNDDVLSGLDLTDFEDFEGVSSGAIVGRLALPFIGYNARKGLFYFGDDVENGHKQLTLAILGLREYVNVEYKTPSGKKAAKVYRKFTPYAEMVPGKRRRKAQLMVWVEETQDVRVLGAGSWTARSFFLNPPTYNTAGHDNRFTEGVWFTILEKAKAIKRELKKTVAPYCFKFTVQAAEKPTELESADGESSESYLLQLATPLQFVGKELALQLEEIYTDYEVEAWVAEREGKGQASEEVFEDEDNPSTEEPFYVATQPTDVEQDEIPF